MWDLESLGFGPSETEAFRAYAEDGNVPGRVAAAHREQYVVFTEAGELRAELAGRLRHAAPDSSMRPSTGDWVVLRPWPSEPRATLLAVLPRRTCLSRKAAGRTTREQIVAANIDTVFLVCGLDRDFNPRRIERSLVLAWQSGAAPVVLLNKADVCADAAGCLSETQRAAPGVPVHVLSGARREGLDALAPYLARGRTAVLVGSSGVGKSTLTNALVGRALQETRDVRASDGRGRHTTTARELIPVPWGGWIVDTPGLRELQLWADEDSAAPVFDDIANLAVGCRFRDCRHATEPGCAVREALAEGRLDAGRLGSYEKLQRELDHLAARQDGERLRAQRRRLRVMHRAARSFYRHGKGGREEP